MKKSHGFLVPAMGIMAIGLLAGCSSNFTLPWDDNALDPSKVATREPLEIPPDLDVLPGNEPPEDLPGRPGARDRAADPRDDGSPSSARSILFKTPEAK
ncbi:MAG: hypothetical protein HQL95_16650, partial [Magnetococcales bacterium]|nr:hypothetical protein [Magnetococcales bacterium]